MPRSLRARLLLALLALVAVVLLALDAVVYGALRGYLLDRTDTSLRGVQSRVVKQVRQGLPPAQGLAADAKMLGTSEYFIEIRRPNGTVTPLVKGLRNPDDAPPSLPAESRPGKPLTVGAVDADGPDYRLLTRPLPNNRGTLVTAVPLTSVDGTLRRLLLIEGVATAAALALLTAAGLWIVRRGLRPLESMARDADAIAAGRGGHRVAPADSGSEVGRLGLALNTMLDGQEATQERLRQFIADASHELRTPVTAILGYADLHAQGALPGPEQVGKAMDGIAGEALRMRRLVDDLLLLARLDTVRAPERGAVDLGEVAEAAVGAARAVAPERRVELEAPRGVVVYGDEEQLRRVVDNLLANVRTHTPPTTTTRILVHSTTDGAWADLVVTDDGPGIPAESLPKVFDRFYRADRSRSGKGSGLGLAIVAAVAEAHGGRVEVAASQAAGPAGAGGGTRVTVRLPLPRG
ncbi:HAMP domain-containing histidine kinase [Streptomyces sp. A7024]|uniref:histidine kinase n=1 Tax=Streptomyces coryli TaxID=1128680 RepID=A0A6G4U0A9_9ACTN|nr:HAMP domain-containing sensor histidine kinase [Streptomyces coryli]NGN64717.1 HAMP domain-containing histidine kinase [Streptomyces coryli]